MKQAKYLFALWVGAAVYVGASLLWGPSGFAAYDQLLTEKEKLEANLSDLRQINLELENARKALLYDRDTLSLYARELGYAAAWERFVRIVGLPGIRSSQTRPGEVLSPGRVEFVPDKMIRIISVCIGLGILMAVGLWDFLRFCRRRAGQGA